MSVSTNPSASNVYSIMSEPGQSMKNIDAQRTMTVGPELQRGVQEVQEAASKGTNEGYNQALRKINILV